MPGFSIRSPFFIIVVCLVLLVIRITSLVRMPVDLFPSINLPEVAVATVYSGMPPQDIETDITDPLERPILMTSLATIIGTILMALKLATGADQYPPMARAIIGGLISSVALTIFILPVVFVLVYGKRNRQVATAVPTETA
jgi:multidrug efflux pump subunit AcrB